MKKGTGVFMPRTREDVLANAGGRSSSTSAFGASLPMQPEEPSRPESFNERSSSLNRRSATGQCRLQPGASLPSPPQLPLLSGPPASPPLGRRSCPMRVASDGGRRPSSGLHMPSRRPPTRSSSSPLQTQGEAAASLVGLHSAPHFSASSVDQAQLWGCSSLQASGLSEPLFPEPFSSSWEQPQPLLPTATASKDAWVLPTMPSSSSDSSSNMMMAPLMTASGTDAGSPCSSSTMLPYPAAAAGPNGLLVPASDNSFFSSSMFINHTLCEASSAAVTDASAAPGVPDTLIPYCNPGLQQSVIAATAIGPQLMGHQLPNTHAPSSASTLTALAQLHTELAVVQAAALASGELSSAVGLTADSSAALYAEEAFDLSCSSLLDSGSILQQQQQQLVLHSGSHAIAPMAAVAALPAASPAATAVPAADLCPLPASGLCNEVAAADLGAAALTSTLQQQQLMLLGGVGQQVVGPDLASAAAAIAEAKLAAMQQLEVLQQQLRDEVVTLLPLI